MTRPSLRRRRARPIRIRAAAGEEVRGVAAPCRAPLCNLGVVESREIPRVTGFVQRDHPQTRGTLPGPHIQRGRPARGIRQSQDPGPRAAAAHLPCRWPCDGGDCGFTRARPRGNGRVRRLWHGRPRNALHVRLLARHRQSRRRGRSCRSGARTGPPAPTVPGAGAAAVDAEHVGSGAPYAPPGRRRRRSRPSPGRRRPQSVRHAPATT